MGDDYHPVTPDAEDTPDKPKKKRKRKRTAPPFVARMPSIRDEIRAIEGGALPSDELGVSWGES